MDKDLEKKKLVTSYINLRTAIEEANSKVTELKDVQKQVSNRILELCNDEDLDGFKIEGVGTVTRSLKHSYWTSDWDAMYDFIITNKVPYLMHKRLHEGNLKEFIADNPTASPPGLQSKTEYTISVRKPTAK